jgi:hypothetical protein
MNSKNFGARITKYEVLDRKIWLQKIWREKGLFRRFWWCLWNFLVAGSFGVKKGLLQTLGNFCGFLVDFGSVWSGEDLIVIIFWKLRVLLQFCKCTGTVDYITTTLGAYSQKGKEYGFPPI